MGARRPLGGAGRWNEGGGAQRVARERRTKSARRISNGVAVAVVFLVGERSVNYPGYLQCCGAAFLGKGVKRRALVSGDGVPQGKGEIGAGFDTGVSDAERGEQGDRFRRPAVAIRMAGYSGKGGRVGVGEQVSE